MSNQPDLEALVAEAHAASYRAVEATRAAYDAAYAWYNHTCNRAAATDEQCLVAGTAQRAAWAAHKAAWDAYEEVVKTTETGRALCQLLSGKLKMGQESTRPIALRIRALADILDMADPDYVAALARPLAPEAQATHDKLTKQEP